jgi:hypothetical protein
MLRLAEERGQDTISLAYPGFRPKESMISELTEWLEGLKLEKSDTVVLDLLSNLAFMGADGGGLPSEAARALPHHRLAYLPPLCH